MAASAFGDLDFDLREATTGQPRTVVTVLAAFGTVDVYAPEGINADVGGLTILGHRRAWFLRMELTRRVAAVPFRASF